MYSYLQKVTSRKNCVKKLVFCWHLEGQGRKQQDPDPGSGSRAESGSGSNSQRHGSPDPDPHQNVMDPEHCFILNIFTSDNFCIAGKACSGACTDAETNDSQYKAGPVGSPTMLVNCAD